jgi:hypothetical protein
MMNELTDLMHQWEMRHGAPPVALTADDKARVVAEARAYVTEHGTELDELLNDE